MTPKRYQLLSVLIGVLLGGAGCKSGTEKNTQAPTAKAPAGPSEGNSPPASEAALSPPSAPPATSEEPPAGSGAPSVESHQFYGVYVQGQKAGWAEQRVQVLDDGGTELWMKVVVRLSRAGKQTGLELVHVNRYAPGPTGLLREVSLDQTLPGGAKSSHRGKVVGDKFEMTVTSGEKSTRAMVPLPKETAQDSVAAFLVRRLQAVGVDTVVTTHQFDPMTQRSIPIQTRLVGTKRTYLSGGEVTVLDVSGVDSTRGLTLTSRLTEGGLSLEMVIGPGFKLVLEDRALAQDQSQGAPDLYRLSRVPIDKPLGSAVGVSRMVVDLEGLSPTVNLTDQRQQLSGTRLEVKRLDASQVEPQALSAEDRNRWLEATPFVDHESPAVRRLLASKLPANGVARLAALNSAVNRAIRYTLATAPLSAGDILKEGRGDCTEYARALAAVLRADGVPAREVSGMAYAGDGEPGFAYHAWTEAYFDGRWIALDPTWNQYPIDATHVAISRDDPSPIVGMLGGLKVKVVTVER